MDEKSLDRIIRSFDPSPAQPALDASVTIWLPSEYKSRYDELQKQSGRRFAKKARELLMAAIDVARERAS